LYSLHDVALGLAGLRQALRQSHMQLSHRITFLPSALRILNFRLSNQPDPM